MSDTTYTVHAPKTDSTRPGVCNAGCTHATVCENNTERATIPENVRLVQELEAYLATNLPNERQYDQRPTFIGKLEYRCEISVASRLGCAGYSENVCEFIGLRDASRAAVAATEKQIARDYWPADSLAKALEHAKAINAICERMKCGGKHLECGCGEYAVSERDVQKIATAQNVVASLFKPTNK